MARLLEVGDRITRTIKKGRVESVTYVVTGFTSWGKLQLVLEDNPQSYRTTWWKTVDDLPDLYFLDNSVDNA